MQTHEVISNAGKSDADKRRKLLDLYKRTEQFMGQFEAEFLEILEKSFEDLNKLDSVMGHLKGQFTRHACGSGQKINRVKCCISYENM